MYNNPGKGWAFLGWGGGEIELYLYLGVVFGAGGGKTHEDSTTSDPKPRALRPTPSKILNPRIQNPGTLKQKQPEEPEP